MTLSSFHRRAVLASFVVLPAQGCQPPSFEIAVSGDATNPTFRAFDSAWWGTIDQDFTGVTVFNKSRVRTLSDMARAVVWGVDANEGTPSVHTIAFGRAPRGWREWHAPEALEEGFVYSAEFRNNTNGRDGVGLFGLKGGQLLSAPKGLAENAFERVLRRS